MAHYVEPMDIDNIEGEFDNKENTYHHSNVLPRTPCTEKGYEELDVSELNMKLRYSITPASSPMSKSYTAHCLDNRNLECPENIANSIDNANLTRSFNSTLTKNDSLSKSLKLQPLQIHTTDQSLDNNRNTSVLRPLDTTVTEDGKNITVTVTEANDNDENLSIPSSSSSALHTPEATTPTKEIPKHDGGSPIMRGLKSVLNMFRASQSPIPSAETEDNVAKHDISSPVDVAAYIPSDMSQVALASTPIATRKQKEPSSKRGSPLKESIVFNEDLEKELLWKDETTILFSEEKIPIHKLFFQQSKHVPPINKKAEVPLTVPAAEDSFNETVEFMDVSYNDSIVKNKTISEITDAPSNANVAESDSEFVDCETTFTQQSDDEHNTDADKQKTTSAVNISENSDNKTAQELQLTATEDKNSIRRVSLDVTIADDIPEIVNQNVPELAARNIEEPIHPTVLIEAKNTIYQDSTQETETNINNENETESLDGTISMQSADKPVTSSTLMNITDFKTQMPNDITPVFDATVSINKEDSLSSSVMNNAIQSIEVTSSINEIKTADTTVSIESNEKPMSVSSFIMNSTQNVTQFSAEQLNTTTAIEDKPVSASTFIMNATQNIEFPLSIENINEPQNATEIDDKPVFTSTFIMNSTQNIKTPSTIDSKNELNVTSNFKDEALSSSIIKNETQNIENPSAIGNINEQLNITTNIQDKPVFIMKETDFEVQTKTENVNENDSTTSIRSEDGVLTEINNISEIKETELNKPLDATMTVSLPMNPTQNADSNLTIGKIDKLLDATVTIDSKDMPASSTFIQDSTQDIESHKPGENSTTFLDSTILLNSHTNDIIDINQKQVSSSTFVEDITQNVGKESLDVTITPESSSLSTFNINVTQDVERQVRDSNNSQKLNSTVVTEGSQRHETPTVIENDPKDIEIYPTSGALDLSLPADKSMTLFVDFKDVTHQIIDPEVVNNCINALDITLNAEEANQPTKEEEKNCETEKLLSGDTLKPSDAKVAMKAPEAIKILDQYNTEREISNLTVPNDPKDPRNVEQPVNLSENFIEQALNHTVSDQVTPKKVAELADSVECKPVNPDLLNSAGDSAKVNVDDDNKTIEIHEDQGCGEHVPANIPLPDEEDIEIEPLKAVQDSHINNAANLSVLPDVINDLDSSNIQEAKRIDEVPINTVDNVPADIITKTQAHAEIITGSSEINNDKVISTENDYSEEKLTEENYELTNTMKENSLKNYDKEIFPENPIELPLPSAHCIDEQRRLEELEIKLASVNKSEEQLESMDVSYNAKDLSIQKDSEITLNNTTTVVRSEITAFDQNIGKAHEEKPNISQQSEAVSSGAKIDPVFNSTSAATLPDINILQNMSVDDMEIDSAPDTSVIAEKTKTKETLLSMPNTESNVVTKKETIHEEIIVSENNSPYVLVSVKKDAENKSDTSLEEDFEKIEKPFDSTSKILPPPPASPPIASKGYNFNFDEIDDPFATKTKIRTSPPVDSPKQTFRPEKIEVKKEVTKRETINKNKRKSVPVRPKSMFTKKNFNSTFDGSLPIQNYSDKKSELASNDNVGIKNISNLNKIEDAKNSSTDIEEPELNVVEKSELENNTDNASKVAANIENHNQVTSLESKSPITSTTPSSSDQSVYLSAATSSGDSITTRNVFNLPEIDDINFNPFATKSKMRLSPSTSLEVGEDSSRFKSDTVVTLHDDVSKDKLLNLSQNKSTHDEKDSSNASDTTCSSKDDKNTTVREVHTDSEDTIEGPFLEAEDNEKDGLGLANNVKHEEFEGLGRENDMMEFSDLPVQDNEDNEMFIDAAAYEFLLNQNKSNVVADSGKESLFLKFDPLFAKRLSSEGIAAALSKIQKRQSTPKKMAKPPQIANSEQAFPGPSTSKVSPQQLNTTEDIAEDLNVTTSKPMMVVTPAVNPIVMPRKSTTPTSSNRRSITFTSPAIAVIDRLLSMSANNSLVDQNTTITQLGREQNEADMALVQLRELLAEKEINVYNLRSESKELKDRLTTLESQMKALEAESEQRLMKVNELNEKLTEKTKINKSMAAVVEEYERTIASLIAETEQDRKRHAEERERLIKERDEQTAHLASMEVSFSDLHSKYEKSKQIILSCKANEDTYKKSIKDFEENLTKMQNNYELLKQHATSKLNHANQELEKMNRAHESEVLKLNAMIKRKELHITSLEETLTQKTKANEELTAICDELINKVG